MQVLVVHADALFPPAHGGAKCMRALAEALAARGHAVTVLLQMPGRAQAADVFAQTPSAISERGIPFHASSLTDFSHAGVRYAGFGSDRPWSEAVRLLGPSSLDLVVVTASVLAQGGAMLDAIRAPARVPVALFAWTLGTLPFGPASAGADRCAADRFRSVAAVFAPSQHTADYVKRWSGREAFVTRVPVFGAGPFDTLADRDGPVVFLNPGDVKGLPIALPLIERFASVPFRLVPGWGTTARDLGRLAGLRNVEIVPRRDAIADVLAGACAVLFPSLVEETFPLVPIEAMLHGIPVLASNLGAVPDAMLGRPYVLPVKPLERVRIPSGARSLARWLSPAQDAGPWAAALRELRDSSAHYASLSGAAGSVAREYVSALRWEPVCEALVAVANMPCRQGAHA